MPWSDLAAHSLGLLAYPGLAFAVLAGLILEAVAAWALGWARGPAAAARAVLAGLAAERGQRSAPPLAALAALMALLAASQVAAPFSPIPAPERNVLVAGVALVAAGWLTLAWGWARPQIDPSLLVLAQLCWMVAVLAPAVVPENLRPQVLGAVLVRELLPLKVAAGILYALCLPVLLQLTRESAPQGLPGSAPAADGGLEAPGFRALRVLLWLPYCGLFSSLFFPPGDGALGWLRFAATTAGVAALSVGIAVDLGRRPPAATRRLYLHLVAPFAGFTVVVAILTASLT